MKYLDLLGYEVKDRVTGFRGVVECVSYDLYGCIQLAVRPGIDAKGKLDDARWFDGKRLIKVTELPVMKVTPFETIAEEAGPAEKPARS